MSSSKFRFEKTSELEVKYEVNEHIIGSLTYDQTGKVTLINEDFETIINNVDEVVMILTPLDTLMNMISFRVKKGDKELKLNQKFYGLKYENLIVNFHHELEGETW